MSSQSDGSNSGVAIVILDFLARKTQKPISYTFFRQVSGALGCLISDPETMTGTEFIGWCERATISELDLFCGQTILPQQTLISKTGTEFIGWCERATISELDLFCRQTILPQQTLISKIVDSIGRAIQNFV